MAYRFVDEYECADGAAKALFAIAIALDSVAYQLKYLGNGDASTPMGALEALGAHLGEKLADMTSALSGIGDSIDRIDT